jgi:hypothetical protein
MRHKGIMGEIMMIVLAPTYTHIHPHTPTFLHYLPALTLNFVPLCMTGRSKPKFRAKEMSNIFVHAYHVYIKTSLKCVNTQGSIVSKALSLKTVDKQKFKNIPF